MHTGDRVTFNTNDNGKNVTLTGTIQRDPWGRSERNVSIKTDDGRTFVRDIDSIELAE